MATKICFTGQFKVTAEYGRKGTLWKSGIHGGIDLVGITSEKVYSIVGLMGATGNTTGKHTHVEIRQFSNGVAVKKLNPANYMGIPNKVGVYNSENYQIKTNESTPEIGTLKTLARI